MMARVWPYYYLGTLLLIALFADVIANDRPLLAHYAGELHLPAFSQGEGRDAWREADVAWVIWPPIQFSAEAMNLDLPAYLGPLSSDKEGGFHWLGTDRLGRDTAAGLISGTRTAVLVGLGSLIIALIVGVPLGAVAGYFGNEGIRTPRYLGGSLIVGIVVGSGYAIGSLLPLAGSGTEFVLMAVLVVGAVGCAAYLLLRGLSTVSPWLRSRAAVPIDRMVQFVLEMSVSIPGLVMLIVILSFVRRPTIWTLVLIIGLFGWTSLARFLRAELIRIRSLPYIAAARVSGVGELRLLFRHALPNALGPVLVVAAFLVGSSILAEAVLSFLGIGVPAQQVTWGSTLQQARMRPAAWWLAVFPGLMLTFTVLACNSLRTFRR
ncbi:peptide/nickel transport system permease protein [Lewinella aquimaris]|uniref:Peptide/nickel transport system permease protein n=1 Tax=Neolewinella aquimaris TaxID=1835722 RepID=A0A840EGT9_9BACT|nr:ABC transporter permease [Neolewinella aquimaris]MBB4081019.1 peptide/nickel transport system permease protein [Neolewinella aquimaris]